MISLTKGQKVSLKKEAPNITDLVIGLGWRPKSSTFSLKNLFGSNYTYDLDASVVVCKDGRYCAGADDLISYSHLMGYNGAIHHKGDNLVGTHDKNDAEQIELHLDALPKSVDKLVVFVTIYHGIRKKQSFGEVEDAYIRIFDPRTNKEILRYSLTDDYKNAQAVIFGELIKEDGGWQFHAVGKGLNDDSIVRVARSYA